MNVLLRIFQTGLNSLQKLESRAMWRREAVSTSTGESDIDLLQFNLGNSNINAFTVFDTYDAYKVYRNQLMLQQMTGQEMAMLIKEEEEDFVINNSELNITCCIMMLDMLLKQVSPEYERFLIQSKWLMNICSSRGKNLQLQAIQTKLSILRYFIIQWSLYYHKCVSYRKLQQFNCKITSKLR